MHPTGIEPVSTPWKGAILPLNYECVLRNNTLVFSYTLRRLFFIHLNALFA
jgi:hypothetical protein